MDRDQVLDLPIRRQIFDFIIKNPGTHPKEITRNCDVQGGSVAHHLRLLEKHEFVVVKNDGRYRRYFSAGQCSEAEKTAFAGFRLANSYKVGLILLEHGPKKQHEIAKLIGVSASTLSFHLGKLSRRGILGYKEVGATKIYFLKDPVLASRVLASLKLSPIGLVI